MALGTKRKAKQTLSVNPVSLPSGAVQEFAGTTAPDGWLMCDGGEVSRTEYASLFSVIGTTYGVGDGSTTFNLPELRGEFVRGLDDMGTARGARGVDSSRTLGSAQADATAANGLSTVAAGNHSHVSGLSSVTGVIDNTSLYGRTDTPNTNDAIASGTSTGTHSWNTSTAGNHSHVLSGDSETRPRNCAMNYIIKL